MNKTELFILNDDGTKSKVGIVDNFSFESDNKKTKQITPSDFNKFFNSTGECTFSFQSKFVKVLEHIANLKHKLECMGIDPDRLLEVYKKSRLSISQAYDVLVQEHKESPIKPAGILNTHRIEGHEFKCIYVDIPSESKVKPLTHKQRQPYYQKFNRSKK